MRVQVEIPTTRIVWGTTTYEVEIESTEAEIRAEFNADPAAFIERYSVATEGEVVDEFDNAHETQDYRAADAELREVRP